MASVRTGGPVASSGWEGVRVGLKVGLDGARTLVGGFVTCADGVGGILRDLVD